MHDLLTLLVVLKKVSLSACLRGEVTPVSEVGAETIHLNWVTVSFRPSESQMGPVVAKSGYLGLQGCVGNREGRAQVRTNDQTTAWSLRPTFILA